jgi:outer membrane protein
VKRTRKLGLAGALALLCPIPAFAQSANAPATPYQAGDLLVHLRAIGVLPQNFSSSVSVIGGHVDATDQAAPEVDLSYFINNHFSVEAIAATTRHEVSATGTAIGNVDVGSVWVLPPTVTVQYHFDSIGRFQPYAGLGLTVVFFYDSHAAGPTVTKAGYSTGVGPALDAGFDYTLGNRWYANFDIKQLFVSTEARINNGAIVAHTSLSPTVIGAGIGYLF